MRRPQLVEEPEDELVRRWHQHRDQTAAAALWRRHQRLVVHLVGRVLRRFPDAPALARGICDEAFVKALQTYDPGRAAEVEQPFRSWFLTLARRSAIDRSRRHRPDEGAEPVVAVEAGQANGLEGAQALGQLRAWVLKHFLPSDWEAIEQYGEGFSWAEIAAANPVRIERVIRFERGSRRPQGGWSAEVSKVLAQCPKLTLRIIGHESSDGISGLERARVVRDRLVAVRPSLERRLEVMATEGPPAVHFEITEGARRSPDAMRMRVSTILDRYRESRGVA